MSDFAEEQPINSSSKSKILPSSRTLLWQPARYYLSFFSTCLLIRRIFLIAIIHMMILFSRWLTITKTFIMEVFQPLLHLRVRKEMLILMIWILQPRSYVLRLKSSWRRERMISLDFLRFFNVFSVPVLWFFIILLINKLCFSRNQSLVQTKQFYHVHRLYMLSKQYWQNTFDSEYFAILSCFRPPLQLSSF